MGGYTNEADGVVYYSASSIGYCSGALYYDRLGVTHEPPPQAIQRAYDEGNDNESVILTLLDSQKVWKVLDRDRCAEAGFTFGEFHAGRGKDYSDQVRVEKQAGGVKVRAHLDGIAECVPEQLGLGFAQGELVVVEAKAFGDSYWSQWKSKGLAAFPVYEWQVSVQMHATGLPCVFVVGKKNKLGVVDFIETDIIMEPPIKWGKIVAKIARIENAVESNAKPTCEEPLMYPCPFYTLHDKTPSDIVESAYQVEPQSQLSKTLKTLVQRYEAHKKHEAEHKREAEAAREALLGYFDPNMETHPLPQSTVIIADDVKFKVKPGGRKGSLQEAKIKQAGLNPEDFRGNGSSWLSVEVVNE